MIIAFVLLGQYSQAFAFPVIQWGSSRAHWVLRQAAQPTSSDTLVSLSLPKPLGLVLEEVEEGKPSGVFVADFAEAGSALAHAEQLRGAVLVNVQGAATRNLNFDAVMDLLVNAPSMVDLTFEAPKVAQYKVGSLVTLKYMQEGKPDLLIEARVGDNLRKVLLDAGAEVYQGMQKLSNCGGAGTCTLCAMDLVDGDGWDDRSEYESKKLVKFGKIGRLSCLNNVQGPATLRKTKR